MKTVTKWTEQEEQLLRDLHEKSKTHDVKKEAEFERLASIINRSSMAIGKRYYNMFPVGKGSEVKVAKEPEVERIDDRKAIIGGKHEKIVWTEKGIDVLKEELLNQIKHKHTTTKTYQIVSERLGMGFSTVCTKISKMKLKLNVDTNIQLYNALVAGVSLELLNNDDVIKKIKHKQNIKIKKQEKVVQQKPSTIIPEVIAEPIEKRSFLQRLNPFYSIKQHIKKLEREVEHLKSQLK